MINDNLQQLAEDYFTMWFLQFEFPDNNGLAYKNNGGSFVFNTKLKQQIPFDWNVVNIKELCQLVWGQCPKGNNILPLDSKENDTLLYCSGAGDMRSGLIVDCQAKTNSSRRTAIKNDILMSVAGSIGALSICDKTISLGRAAVAFRTSKDNLAFCYFIIKKYISRIKSISSGSIQKVINDSHIDDINFAYNPKIVSKFAFANTILEKCISLELENRKLANLRNNLLPLLMNGQVTIS